MTLALRLLRYPLLRLYDAAVMARNATFALGWREVKQLDRPVISVGNLSMGGAGKTPVTAALMAMCQDQGLKVAVLSRGYGRRQPKASRQVRPEDHWRDTGDEPLMLARRYPSAKVLVGPSRWSAAQADTGAPPDLYLLDDGFQHRALHRDLDIVLIDVKRPFPFPWSTHLFREHLPALKRAQVVVLTRCSHPDEGSELVARIRKTNPDLLIMRAGLRSAPPVTLDGEPLDLTGRKAAAFAGIAQPGQFFATLEKLAIEPAKTLALQDHQPLTGRQRVAFESGLRREGITRVITTEKDGVKLEGPFESDIIYGFIPIDIDWMGMGDQLFQSILKRVNA